jgi:ATP-dependent protease ClpP protease subunit
MKTWFSIRAQTATEPAEVSIYGDIGSWGVNAASFIDAVKNVQGPIRVRINSGGGDVFDGLAIYNYLAGRGNVETVIDGLAASAASLPFLAGNKRRMPKAAFLMVHNPWSGSIGNAAEMRKAADVLDRIGAGLANVYARVTGMAVEAVQALMDAETWLDGDAALAGKWATEIVDLGPVKASVRRGRYARTPALILGAEWTAPEAARNAFRKGIQQSEDGLAGDGLEAATVKEARALASGERPTDFKVRKANAWWGRNERFLDAEANTPADVAANLWGGAAGRDWFRALFNELEAEQASVRAAAPGELAVADYVELSYGDGKTKGEVVEVLTTGTASGADGAVDATADDPAALVDVLREVGTTGDFKETDVQVARLFSTLTKVDAPRIVEVENPEAKAKISAVNKTANNQTEPMSKTAKLFALLGVQPAAEDPFLASAIADLGVTPEAVTEARKTGTTDFLATHIADRIAAADNRTNSVLAAVGVDAKATDLTAAVKAKVDELAAKKAAEILAAKGIRHDVGNAAAATGAATDKSADEIRAEFGKMKPGAERTAFFNKHKAVLIS